MMAITREHKRHGNFEGCLSIRNGAIELILATAFGPRVLYLGSGQRNLLAEISPETQRKTTPYGDDWHIYGGHRLWYAPEHAERSYYPDNAPLQVEMTSDGARVVQPTESHSGLQKSITVALPDATARAVITHRIENRGGQVVELAPWALSAMAPGGVAIFPQVPFQPHPDALAPARPLVLWPFTQMRDPRWTWGDRYLLLRQDVQLASPQKVGLYDPAGYMAYALGDQLFIKCHSPRAGAHADFGCNVETFTNELFLELETLGPLVQLSPGESVEHVEHWFVFGGGALESDEQAIERALAAPLAEIRRTIPLPDLAP
jgi:hypothetical protein